MVAGLPSRFRRDRQTVGKKKSLLAAASTAMAGGDKCGSEIPQMPQGQNKLRPDGVAFNANKSREGGRVGDMQPPCPALPASQGASGHGVCKETPGVATEVPQRLQDSNTNGNRAGVIFFLF